MLRETFASRRAAGRALAQALQEYAGSDTVVLGLTRGGLVVADEVAQMLHLPLDVLVVHKITEPLDARAHVGAVAEPHHVVMHRHRLRALSLATQWLEQAVAEGRHAVQTRGAIIRGGRPRRPLAGHRALVVDDAAGTGATLRAAVRAVQAQGAREIVVAVPVAPAPVLAALQRQGARVVCLGAPAELVWHGIHYPRPGELTDAEARELLDRAAQAAHWAEVRGDDASLSPTHPTAAGRPCQEDEAGEHG
jgi:putative phosphoribosyl transferase